MTVFAFPYYWYAVVFCSDRDVTVMVTVPVTAAVVWCGVANKNGIKKRHVNHVGGELCELRGWEKTQNNNDNNHLRTTAQQATINKKQQHTTRATTI